MGNTWDRRQEGSPYMEWGGRDIQWKQAKGMGRIENKTTVATEGNKI